MDDRNYVYESPDSGITLYRRLINNRKRELVGNVSKEPVFNRRVAVVFGGGGFIGAHLVKKLKTYGCWVRVVDLKRPPYADSHADDYIVGDLRDYKVVFNALLIDRSGNNPQRVDELYQLAADMGGAGFVFSGKNDSEIMHNSAMINLNTVNVCVELEVKKIFYSSSACIYPAHNQLDPDNPNCAEDTAYPANPDSEYGWEKLFSERLYLAYAKNHGLNIRIARFHNIFGPEGTWKGGREKAPAALCRKIAESDGSINIWGDGKQTRSFLYIDECIEAVMRLMGSSFIGPVNIGSDEMVSIESLVNIISDISGKSIEIVNVDGPEGVRGRNSDNTLIKDMLGWSPTAPLRNGLKKTYKWIDEQVRG